MQFFWCSNSWDLPTSHPHHSPEDPHRFFFGMLQSKKGTKAPFHVSFQEMCHEILRTCHWKKDWCWNDLLLQIQIRDTKYPRYHWIYTCNFPELLLKLCLARCSSQIFLQMFGIRRIILCRITTFQRCNLRRCHISPSALHPICFPSPLLWRRGYWSSLLGGRCWRTWRLEG